MGKRNRRRQNRRSNANNRANRANASALTRPQPPRKVTLPSPAWIYPSGCLYTLTEQERNSPEMNRYADIVTQFDRFKDSYHGNECALALFWDRPENKFFLNNSLARIMIYQAMLVATKKLGNWEDDARGSICFALSFAGSIKLGSARAFGGMVALSEINEDQARFTSVLHAIHSLLQSSDFGLLYVLDQLTPCNCLRNDIAQEEQNSVQEGNEEARFVCCVCNKREERPRMYKMCRPCGMRCYCSHDCHVIDWRQGPCVPGPGGVPHKEICLIICEISFVSD